MKPSKEVANNWALRDPLESACHLGECTLDIHLAGFWAPVGRKWNARSPRSQRGGEEWVVYSEVIKAFLALKMTEECLELETQWCKSNVVIVFCPETLEALNILLGSGRSASEHLTQCREARKPGCYADCWARWFSTRVSCVTPDSSPFEYASSQCYHPSKMVEVSKNKTPNLWRWVCYNLNQEPFSELLSLFYFSHEMF